MNPSTVTKCLVLKASSLLPELQEMVKSYAFYDTQEYHRHKFHKTLQIIGEAYSRKNGYKKDIDSETDEWWTFIPRNKELVFPEMGEQLCLHAKSCSRCGNYRSSKTNFLDQHNQNTCTRIQCDCSYQSADFIHYYDGVL
uniref:Uncharacterized protein n=1 Tax=viral metagenome TaxID=1070528 RepID=A0A6C0HTS7_9ZZZZ